MIAELEELHKKQKAIQSEELLKAIEEYSRIIIEEYCMNHPKTQKADFLWEMVHMSYDIACEPEPWQLMHLSQLISRERNPELRDALEDLDEFMNGY